MLYSSVLEVLRVPKPGSLLNHYGPSQLTAMVVVFSLDVYTSENEVTFW